MTKKGVEPKEYTTYFKTFQRYKTFGLPHGKGWLDELPWFIDFAEYMEGVHNTIEVWKVRNG